MTRKFRIGIAQLKQSADMGRNLRRIGKAVCEAAEARTDCLVLPECAMTGYAPAFHDKPPRFDPDAIEAGVEELSDLARAHGIALAVGTILPAKGGWTNSLLCISERGRLLARYDKTHMFDRDEKFFLPGAKGEVIARVKGVPLGLQICFDIRFPELFRRLALKGAKVILAPSHIHGRNDMWKRPVIEAHVRSRAAENGRFVVFANAAGVYQNVPSMIADPRGEIVAAASGRNEEIVTAEIDLSMVNNTFLRGRRTDLYGA